MARHPGIHRQRLLVEVLGNPSRREGDAFWRREHPPAESSHSFLDHSLESPESLSARRVGMFTTARGGQQFHHGLAQGAAQRFWGSLHVSGLRDAPSGARLSDWRPWNRVRLSFPDVPSYLFKAKHLTLVMNICYGL